MGQPREKRPAPSADDSLSSDPNLDDEQNFRTLLAQVVADNKVLKQAYEDLNSRLSQFLEINSGLVAENSRLVSENEALRNLNRSLQQNTRSSTPAKSSPTLPDNLARLSSQDKNDRDFVDAICAEAGIPCPDEVFFDTSVMPNAGR
ncbi:unnamed protein product [Caenorhabditis auriculariae]|uniref:Uncharacterized protein n=1 Tax=Caenorhabditis auriculariae TaxID=2777116 RepID=A0A8S1HQL7_9PELO|nr:unnamed protein product [Caenorhabditis auriculariae]